MAVLYVLSYQRVNLLQDYNMKVGLRPDEVKNWQTTPTETGIALKRKYKMK